ncbi:NUDIX hydrolase [Paraburkholderia tropica]|uniref:NUDIX hydrolase n=1 Tax=Paraburkholderia tropica TaxID=92647 RepID=UPI002AB30536|nr:NUDIX domain-containing protein [Paraburkholderia tropica]
MKDRATVICRRRDEILLVTRGNGRWALPGGAIRTGELPADAARREFVEETGATPGEVRFLFFFGGLRKRHHVFSWTMPEDVTPLPSNEIVGLVWCRSAKDPELAVSVPTREILRLYAGRFAKDTFPERDPEIARASAP